MIYGTSALQAFLAGCGGDGQRALGHSSVVVTLTTYSHLWPDADHRTRKAVADQ